MTWSIKFNVAEGGIDARTLKVVGTPPDGPVIVTGYETDQGRMLGVQAGEVTVSTYAPHRVAVPAGGTVVDADQLARAAYRAYSNRTGGKTVAGDTMRTWDELDDTIRDAWTHAAAAVMRHALEGE